jgi:hypothetical protein
LGGYLRIVVVVVRYQEGSRQTNNLVPAVSN